MYFHGVGRQDGAEVAWPHCWLYISILNRKQGLEQKLSLVPLAKEGTGVQRLDHFVFPSVDVKHCMGVIFTHIDCIVIRCCSNRITILTY